MIDSGTYDWFQNDKSPSLTSPAAEYHGLTFAESFGNLSYTLYGHAVGLRDLGAHVLGPEDPNLRSAIVAARFPGKDSADFAVTLKKANVIASLRRDFIRFSPHLYNSTDDIDQALIAIKAAL